MGLPVRRTTELRARELDRSRGPTAGAREEPVPDPRPFARRAALLRRPEPRRSARHHREAPSPWAEDEVLRSGHLARAFRRTRLRGRRSRDGPRARLLEAAPEGPEPRTKG